MTTKGKCDCTPARIRVQLTAQLNSYGIAASAAGVAIIACAFPAEATPICGNISVNFSDTGSYSFNPVNQEISPFIVAQTYNNLSSHTQSVELRGFFTPNAPSAKVVLGTSGSPADLVAGAVVGSTAKFGKGNSYGEVFQYRFSQGVTGPFSSGQPGFIGFEFFKVGQIHYGWLRLRVNLPSRTNYRAFISLSGYGYESSPKTAIAAGDCGTSAESPIDISGNLNAATVGLGLPDGSPERTRQSLGLLAVGSGAVPLWRQNKP